MKKWLCLMAVLCLLPLFPARAAQYAAMVNAQVKMRSEKGDGVVVGTVPKFSDVNVQEYGEDYCRISYNKQSGYVATEYLFSFRSLDPMNYKVPGHVPAVGFVTLDKDTWLEGGDFLGTMMPEGTVVCVTAANESDYTVPVWRDYTDLDAACGAYTPFVYWEDAQSGDVIGGFTTFYGEQQGKGLAAERESNILRGCELLDGYVLTTDYRFSFNRLCAPYATYNGYKYAPNIGGDGFGYGGGVCQLTTTLFNAVLPLPLRLRDWCVHQYEGVVYVPQFMDAAVGREDFSFLNQLPYEIRFSATARDGVITVLIYRV